MSESVSGTISTVRPMVQQGWQCPVCKTVHAPYMPTCTRCSPAVVVKQGTHTVTTGEPYEPKEGPVSSDV